MSLLEIDESISTQDSRENCDRYTGSGMFRKSQFVICNSCYWCASFTDLETHHSMTCPCCGCERLFKFMPIPQDEILKMR
jgi:uncharacterized paraquat-inducible protein A